MSFLRKLTSQMPNWLPSLAGYGGAAAATLVYFTEWKVITENLPLYNTKYSEE